MHSFLKINSLKILLYRINYNNATGLGILHLSVGHLSSFVHHGTSGTRQYSIIILDLKAMIDRKMILFGARPVQKN